MCPNLLRLTWLRLLDIHLPVRAGRYINTKYICNKNNLDINYKIILIFVLSLLLYFCHDIVIYLYKFGTGTYIRWSDVSHTREIWREERERRRGFPSSRFFNLDCYYLINIYIQNNNRYVLVFENPLYDTIFSLIFCIMWFVLGKGMK